VTGYRKQIKANKKIDEQHKSIKSSINYAKRIQEAMLPKHELQKRLLPDSFILLKPRDSVSGDFYWFTEMKSWYNPDVIFTVADCTGHGVPGAFMSLIGINALNGIINKGIAETDQILSELHQEIRTALQQETTGNNDGMDVALCIYRKEKNTLEFSGAKNSLIYIQDNKLFQVKGDVHPIGGSRSKKEFSYKKHIVPIEKSTMIYLFSDGYRDQFGGKNNTKFMAKKLNELLLSIHQRPLPEQKEILDKTIEEWRGHQSQTDDILVMGIRLEAIAI
jgi:serine phosphatase RsbU (regulator of sigma subunit)